MPAKHIALSEADTPLPVPTEAASARRPSRQRKKLWELQSHFHCSVIGTCLTLEELRRLCRKANIIFETAVSDHALHSAFVNVAGESAYPSRLLQKHLDNKYKRIIQHVVKIRDADALPPLWHEAMKSGEVASAFWALLTHPQTSDELLEQMYGDIHMLSHLAGSAVRVDMQKLSQQHRRIKDLEAQLKKLRHETQRKLNEKDETIQTISQRLQQTLRSEQKLAQREHSGRSPDMQKQIDELSNKLTALQTQKERAEDSASEWKQFAIRSEDRNLRLEQALAEAQQQRDALEASLASLLSRDCRNTCPQEKGKKDLDLCNRCVLYVGGRAGQHSHFRTLVEQSNGRFIHHDGGREDSRHQLGSMLPQADAVICPLDCVSHDAVRRVKRFCNRYDKTLILLPRGSLSAFTQGLSKVAS